MRLAALAVLAALAAAYAQKGDEASPKPDRELTLVNIEYEGTKVWVPATVIVKKGERVKLTLVNNAPSGIHGFSIKDFGVLVSVQKGKKEEVEFTASAAGLFKTQCQLHPAHLGGQLLVLE